MFLKWLFSFVCIVSWASPCHTDRPQKDIRIPEADGLFHVYVLPIGLGDCNVIQCPDGTLAIVDMGTGDVNIERFWGSLELRTFLEGNFGLIGNIIITHQDPDHISLFPETLNVPAELTGLLNIYITCTANDMVPLLSDWVTSISGQDKLRTFNNGGQCGPRGGPCGSIDICPNNPEISLDVLAANLGQHCAGGVKNMDSIVSKITFNNFTIMLPGDFEDETTDWEEDGQQKWMTDFYGSELQVTVYETARHGSSAYANKPIWIEAISPSFIFSSGDPWWSGDFPSCDVFDDIINMAQTLCKPGVTDPLSPEYCGEHILGNPDLSDILQAAYTCGTNSTELVYRTGNEYALYTATPDDSSLHLIEVSTDGTKHGIRIQDATV